MCKKKLRSIVSVATLGLIGGSDSLKSPDTPQLPAAPDAPPTEQSPEVQAAREDEKRRRAAASGQGSTILTGAQGLTTPASTAQKTLLGA